MANWSEEYWDVNGSSLHTMAWGVEKIIDALPPKRGSNFVVPYRHGELWRPKFYGPKAMALAMWVNDADADGNIAATDTARRAQVRQNIETLKALFAPVDEQLTITRRMRLQSGLVTRTAKAECLGTLDFEPDDDFGEVARFAAELLMADPFWYGTASVQGTIPFAGGSINNPGTATAQYMTVTLNGPLTNPRLENGTVSVTYSGVIGGGGWVELDTRAFTAQDHLGSNVIGGVTHSGGKFWMELHPGDNELIFAAGSGTGNAVLTFYPPYL